jgi:chemotaxis protein CheD
LLAVKLRVARRLPPEAPKFGFGCMGVAVESNQNTASAEPVVHVHPGDVVIVAEPTRLVTVLGSCVAVCMYDLEAKVAGMNHYLFPETLSSDAVDRGRFGDFAISKLAGGLLARGARPAQLRAKLFGGASPENSDSWHGEQAGARNIATALSKLAELGIPVLNKDVGGTKGRRVEFHSRDGSVYVRRI